MNAEQEIRLVTICWLFSVNSSQNCTQLIRSLKEELLEGDALLHNSYWSAAMSLCTLYSELLFPQQFAATQKTDLKYSVLFVDIGFLILLNKFTLLFAVFSII